MTEQTKTVIIGVDMDGNEIPDGATVRFDGEGIKEEGKGKVTRVHRMDDDYLDPLTQLMVVMEGRGEALSVEDGGGFVLAGDVRLVEDIAE